MVLTQGYPSSHQLKSYVASKSQLKLAARAVLSADAGLLVTLMTGRRVFSTGELAINAVAAAVVARGRCNSILYVGEYNVNV